MTNNSLLRVQKSVLLLLLLILPVFAGMAQQSSSRYDNYSTRKVHRSTTDLLEEGRDLKETDPKEALARVEEALAVSIAERSVYDEGRCYILLGEINEHIHEWKLAFDNYSLAYDKLKGETEGKAKSKVVRSDEDIKKAVAGMGRTSLQLGNHQEALSYFEEYMKLRLTMDERVQGRLNISEAYYLMGNYDQALKEIEQAKHYNNPKVGLDPLQVVAIQNQEAKIYARTKDIKKATNLFNQSQNTLQNRSVPAPLNKKETESLKEAKDEIIDALRQEKKYDDEIDLRNKSIEYNQEVKNYEEVASDMVEIGKILAERGETSTAVRELERAAHVADTIGNPKEQAKAFLALAGLYEKNNSPEEAISAYKRYSGAIARDEALSRIRLTEKEDLIRKQKDIEELTKYFEIVKREDAIREATVFRQQLIIYGLLFMMLITSVTSYFIYKNAKASKTANRLLALKSLRSQMNPHFIFNALNSVNHFVARNDERTANRFLSEFSMLMRLVLENSQEDFITLAKEYEIISLYLRLEHYRFRDKFDYELKIDPSINLESVELPPMLIQPYIENAVWHGLRYKETKGFLSVEIRKEASHFVIDISDNGIGRKKSMALKTENQKKHNSTGLKNIRQRLEIINKVYHKNYRVNTEDLSSNGEGTRVLVYLPLSNHNNGHDSSDH